MSAVADQFGAEGAQEHREEALNAIRTGHFEIQGNNFQFRGSKRITIKSLQILVEFEYDGVPAKDFAVFSRKV
ncbi:MAG: hypothetical protein J0L53_18820 [Spirochaetes bacterium]|nr:hypothetical protein [Spirochaetota bacterium]